jgi:hypothetical protein
MAKTPSPSQQMEPPDTPGGFSGAGAQHVDPEVAGLGAQRPTAHEAAHGGLGGTVDLLTGARPD